MVSDVTYGYGVTVNDITSGFLTTHTTLTTVQTGNNSAELSITSRSYNVIQPLTNDLSNLGCGCWNLWNGEVSVTKWSKSRGLTFGDELQMD